MPKFFYKSKLNGKIKEGFVEAKNMQKASEKIEAWGMVLLELKEQGHLL